MYDVVSLGSVNVDHVGYLDDDEVEAFRSRYPWFPRPGETVHVDAVPEPLRAELPEVRVGGKGANQAVAAARAGSDVTFLGAVGDDDEAFGVTDGIARYGVDVDRVASVDGPTGSAYIVVDDDAENRIAVLRGANASVDIPYVRRNLDAIREADCLLLQNEIPPEPVAWLCNRLSDHLDRPTVVYDPSPARGAETVLAAPTVDVVTPNESEAVALADHLDAFQGTVVTTHGSNPVEVRGHESFEVQTPSVTPVDTTGAGDVFVGYFAASLAAGLPFETAVERAATAAACSTEIEGVHEAIPDVDAVEARLER